MKKAIQLVALTGCITGLCLWLQPNSLRAVLSVLIHQPLLILLNALPIGLSLLSVSFLCGNVFSAAGVTGAVWGILSLVNTIKMQVRDEPLFPRDFALVKEAFSAVGSYQIQWPWLSIAVILLWLIAMLALSCWFGKFHQRGPRWLGRIGGGLLSLMALSVLILTVYASNDLYNSFSVSNPYYVPSVFNELGFPYCFCHHFTTYAVDKPEGFARAEAEEWDTAETTPAESVNVNVVMVMDEAFSDITDSAVFSWDDDPLQNFHALQTSGQALSGHIVVPNFAGGTANTEFDVLTGMQTNALSETTTSAFRVVNRNLDSLFRVFGADGYQTEFLHPGDDWFYNRENVYQWFGADTILFANDMDGLTYKGRWVTDESMGEQIIARLDSTLNAGTPLFHYTTTIQNHMSYTADKYGETYTFPEISTDMELSDEARTLLQVYTEGVRDADALLGTLAEDFSNREEPIVLVFFGDHLPYLGDHMLAYQELEFGLTPEEEGTDNYLRSYETPYVIWVNNAAAVALDWDNRTAALDLPSDGRISACFLGTVILELTGRGDDTPWFQFLCELRRVLPVIQNRTYVTADGTITTEVDTMQAELISKLRCWSYYKLKYKEL